MSLTQRTLILKSATFIAVLASRSYICQNVPLTRLARYALLFALVLLGVLLSAIGDTHLSCPAYSTFRSTEQEDV